MDAFSSFGQYRPINHSENGLALGPFRRRATVGIVITFGAAACVTIANATVRAMAGLAGSRRPAARRDC